MTENPNPIPPSNQFFLRVPSSEGISDVELENQIREATENMNFEVADIEITRNPESNSGLVIVSIDEESANSEEVIATLDSYLETLSREINLQSPFTIPQPGSSGGPSTTGGPGILPSPADHKASCSKVYNFITNPVKDFADIADREPTSEVNVYVLDTSPYRVDHEERFLRRLGVFGNVDSRGQHWEYITHFLKEPGEASPIQIDEVNLVDTHESFTTHDSPQGKGSHGIFIASIIRTIAPEANVKILPVLPVVGAGQLDDIVTALKEIKEIPGNAQVLVNLSAYADIVASATPGNEKIIEFFNKLGIDMGDPNQVETALDMLAFSNEKYIEEVHGFGTENRKIIAAAGNDWTDQGKRPWPRFPAYLNNVISVGAAHWDGSSADYSSMVQIPKKVAQKIAVEFPDFNVGLNNGIYATGGTANAGLKGLYIDEYFYLGKEKLLNSCGVAQWAGTSFATAVVTGCMAYLCLRGLTAADAEQKLRDELPPKGPDGLPVLMVRQDD